MLEIVKTVGSIVGLLTGAFILYDRYAKGRPMASLTIEMDGTRKKPCIRVSNATQYDFAVIDTGVLPGTYFLTENLEVGNASIPGSLTEQFVEPAALVPTEDLLAGTF